MTLVTPAVVAQPAAPAVQEVAHDWRAMAVELTLAIEKRVPVRPDLEPLIAAIRAAAGMTVATKTSIGRPIVVPATAATAEAADEPDDSDDERIGDVPLPSDPAPVEELTFEEIFGGEPIGTRGIVPGDDWLDPHGSAARREAADPDAGKRNQMRLEAERKRVEDRRKSMRRPGVRS